MKSTIAVLVCVCLPLFAENESDVNYDWDPCLFGCPAIVDSTLNATCIDEGATSDCSVCTSTETVATLTCKVGYQVVPDPGYNTVTCLAGSSGSAWSKRVYSCSQIMADTFYESLNCIYGCPSINDSTLNPSCHNGNETLDCTKCLPVNATVTLTCQPGYEIKPFPGYNKVTCATETAGTWSEPLYSCKPAPKLNSREPPPNTRPMAGRSTTRRPTTRHNQTPHRHAHLVNADNCGYIETRQLLDVRSANARADVNKLPWMALLKYNTTKRGVKYKYSCSGSILSRRYILTAAKCLAYLRDTDILASVLVGVHNFRANGTSAPVEILVERSIVHPRFNPGNMENNIALLRLAEPIDLASENVKSICLPVEETMRTFPGDQLIVAGWGLDNPPAERNSTLQSVSLPVVTECKAKFIGTIQEKSIGGHHICVGGDNRRDSCVGDSGGPIVHLGLGHRGFQMVQYAVGSFAPMCNANKVVPSVVTRVEPYMNWILDNMEE